jgi:ATP synthase protein I
VPAGFRCRAVPWTDRFEPRVRNSLSSGRRLAARVVAIQVLVAVVAALAWLVAGRREAVAAAFGGGLVAVATAVFAWRYFAGGVGGGAQVAGRFVVATALKWLLLVGGLYLALARLELPPLPLLSAFGAGLLAHLSALRFK